MGRGNKPFSQLHEFCSIRAVELHFFYMKAREIIYGGKQINRMRAFGIRFVDARENDWKLLERDCSGQQNTIERIKQKQKINKLIVITGSLTNTVHS